MNDVEGCAQRKLKSTSQKRNKSWLGHRTQPNVLDIKKLQFLPYGRSI
jgi:hypothetical protein